MSKYCDYVRENILTAIYRTVGIELPGMPFSEVKDIVENQSNNIPYEDVLIVNGIKRTWEYTVEEAGNTPLELDTILYYNFLLMEDLMLAACSFYNLTNYYILATIMCVNKNTPNEKDNTSENHH